MLKSSILHFIIIGLFSSVLLGSSTTISELKSPDKNTVDFTFNSVNKTSQSFSTGTIVDKVSYELNSLQKLFPRLFKVSGCQKDSYNTLYCPDALVKAGEYWGYDQSEVIAKKQTVIDFEQGTYQELTSTVRDFMDGFASTHNSTVTDYQTGSGTSNVGTVIDYQNGSSTVGTGSVMDFTSKVNTSSTSYSNANITLQNQTCTQYDYDGICVAYGWQNVSSINYIINLSQPDQGFFNYQRANFRISSNLLQSDSSGSWQNVSSISHLISVSYGINSVFPNKGFSAFRFYNGSLQEQYCTSTDYDGNCTGYGWRNASEIKYLTSVSQPMGAIYNLTFNKFRIIQTCPSGTLTNGQCATTTNTLQCPSGYTDNGTNCQKLVSFNFYQYTCPASYSPINSGFTSYSKSDPNTSTENWNSLDDAINSATPPTGNCQKTITYSYYKYNCPTGYTVNDGGLTSACPRTDPNNTINNEATLSQACNNSTPPTGNCTKIIPYTFYSYECSSGYTAIDKGLATCTKTDSSTSTDTSATLDDPCNSVTPPKENCYKDISYKHYTYGCSPGYITDNYGLSFTKEII